MRPLAALLPIALDAKPPLERGQFRPNDLVELTTLDPTIKLDIRYATARNFLGTSIYSQARISVAAGCRGVAPALVVRAPHIITSLSPTRPSARATIVDVRSICRCTSSRPDNRWRCRAYMTNRAFVHTRRIQEVRQSNAACGTYCAHTWRLKVSPYINTNDGILIIPTGRPTPFRTCVSRTSVPRGSPPRWNSARNALPIGIWSES